MDEINQSADFQKSQISQPIEQPVQQPVKKEKNIFKYLFFVSIFVFLIIITIIIIFFTKNNKTISTNDSDNQVESETISPTTIVNNILTESVSNIDINQIYQQALEIAKSQTGSTLSLKNNFGTVWTTDDNETIFIKSNDTSFEISKINNKNSNLLNDEISELLTANNFSINSKNTIKNENYSFNSYESLDGNYKCVVYFPNQTPAASDILNSPFNFTCFTKEQLESNYQEQVSFIQNLNLKSSIIFNINTKNNEAVLKLSDRTRMSVTHINPSYYAYKSEGKWIYIFSGNDICSCEDLSKRDIPKEHWVNCCYENNSCLQGNFSLK